MPRIEMQHDPGTGQWSVAAGYAPVFKVTGASPDCDAWWQWLRCRYPGEADQFRGDGVRRDFQRSVALIQDGCYCEGCTGRRPLTYRQARTRYMDSGTITDKDAMLACVTLTVPDLDTIGRDWEPAAPLPAAVVRKPRTTRERAGIGFIATAVALLAPGYVGVPPPILPTTALGCLCVGFALHFWPKVRR